MKPLFKKLIGIGILAALIGAGSLFDAIRAATFSVDFLSATRVEETPTLDEEGKPIPSDVGISDGVTKVDFVVRVTHYGNPSAGHVLYIKTNRGIVGRMATDGEGYVRFRYDCYYSLTPKDVVFTASDENNSVFVMIPATGSYTLKMIGSTGNSSGMTTDDIFFPIEGGDAR